MVSRGTTDVAISPDGRRLSFLAENEGTSQLYVRSLDDPQTIAIPGTQGVEGDFFFSPDGDWLGFAVRNELKKVSLSGGTPITLGKVDSLTGGSWGSDTTIVFTGATDEGEGLFLVSAAGGVPRSLALADPVKGETRYSRPQLLPKGDVLFTLHRNEATDIAVLSQNTGEHRIIVEGAHGARYVKTGHLVYAVGTTGPTLMAVPLDLGKLEITGGSVPVIQQLRTSGSDYAISNDGTLVYIPQFSERPERTLVWVDREGKESKPLVEEPLNGARYVHLSPDGQRLTVTTTGHNELWVYDLTGRPPYPLWLEGGSHGVWSPDGEQIVFSSSHQTSGSVDLFLIPADGSTFAPEPLLLGPGRESSHSWSRDGEIIFDLSPEGGGKYQVMVMPIEGEREPRLVVETDYVFPTGQHSAARLSPNGKWLAYVSAVTGEPEIWVRPYPGPGAPLRISPNGGLEPVWGPRGLELFYLEGNKLMAAKIENGTDLRFLPPELLFEGSYSHTTQPSYDVGPGGRFLMMKAVVERSPYEVHVILNWFEELKRLVPAE